MVRVVLVVLLVKICFIVFVWGVVLRVCVFVVGVCFNDVEVVIVGVRRFGTYYINIGDGLNVTCIANLHLSLDQMINYRMYDPFI